MYPLEIIRNANEADIIIAQDPKTGFLAYYANIFAKKPVIFQMCQDFIEYLELYDFNFLLKRFIIGINKIMLKKCCKSFPIVALSNHIKKRAEYYGAKKTVVIPIHGIDFKILYPKKTNLKNKLGIKGPMLLTVGRLTPEKGTSYLIDSVKDLVKDYPSLKLVIIGIGYLENKLKKQAEDLGIKENVIFEGFVDHRKLIDYFNAADLFVLPSLKEGLGYVSGEALVCKTPVIGSNVGGIPDVVINNKTGLLVPPRDTLALTNAVKKLLNNKLLAKKLAENGRAHILKNFEEKVVTKKFEEYINKFIYH